MDLAQECAAEAAGLTVPGLVRRNAEAYPERPALTAGEETLSWAELRTRVAEIARGLGALGLSPRERLLIMMTSRFEHWIADLAAAHVRAISCTAYHTLSPDQITYVATHSGASVVVLEGADEVARWRPALAASTTIRHVVVVDDDVDLPDDERFVRWADLAARGARLHGKDPAVLEKLTDEVVPGEPVAMMYTSGTTGDPKAVVLSHYNVLYEAVALDRLAPMDLHAPTIAYLPLAHVAERELAIYRALYKASHVFICADPSQVVSTLATVRPPSFFGVPRVWEKIAGVLKSVPDGADGLVKQLGLDGLSWPGSGSAPLPGPVRDFLAGLGVDVLEVWGMSETTGCATANVPGAAKPGTVGRPLPGIEIRIAEDGEILVRGPLVFLGYLQPDGSVREDTDEDGWLATGDIGAVDEDGFLTITDRKKELIITSSGKNVAPTKIEGMLRAHPLVGYAVAVGDQRPYLTALITLDEETAPGWAAARGITGTLTYLAGHPAVRAELDALLEEANGQLARAEQIKRYAILPEPWTAESGELTPTLKLRRRIIHDRYSADIASLYG
ncbi:long-chain fatty acid--CoA ligase [Amycolatopsis acidicola]|uniref:Acyl-CoA synthetase n=1 Tax=Amycolatopsis acidicola TaxID=2596893 RepID=A0A5N0ULB3_9PSEU|nr:AMP-dependent synthetase/ligase [Amycolatopsis acidicola]KAA9149218.1 long-chain fatty acid--CoA ligase [Amycolatopsis acidicola]